MANRVVPLNPGRSPLRPDGSLEPAFQLFAQELANRALIIGSGAPEGVTEASQGALYMNTLGTAGAILYVKKTADISGDRKEGWVLV
jgi:hypothetical protein